MTMKDCADRLICPGKLGKYRVRRVTIVKTQLTEGEIKKWRGILFGKFGPYVFAMTNDQFRAIYEKLTNKLSQRSNQTTHKR